MQRPRPNPSLYEPLLSDENIASKQVEPQSIELTNINVVPSEFIEPPELHEPQPKPRSEIVDRVLNSKI